MASYLLAFSVTPSLGDVLEQPRLRVEGEAGITVARDWRRESVPGRYVVFEAPRSNRLRDALAETEVGVEGIVELLPDKGDDHFEELSQVLPVELSVGELSVLRRQVRNSAFEVYGFAPPPLIWCARCNAPHRRGRHVL